MKHLSKLVWLVAALGTAGTVQAQSTERTGEQIVGAQCAKCHQTGVGGAPRIDDRAAWTPRMKQGLNATVRSAIKGHGGMPARGGLADLTDTEVRAAILYMFYPAGATAKPAPAAPATPADPHRKVIGGIEVNLGIVPAELAQSQSGAAPKGSGNYHINISLRDAQTHAAIKNMEVQARVANPVTGGQTKKLALTTMKDEATYGNYFRMIGKEPYTITVQIRPPQNQGMIETKFEFRP